MVGETSIAVNVICCVFVAIEVKQRLVFGESSGTGTDELERHPPSILLVTVTRSPEMGECECRALESPT